MDAGPLFEARFEDLLPDTLYRVEVRLDQVGSYKYPFDLHQFELRTEPAPDGWLPPTRLATDIRAVYADGEIEVTWTPPETGSRYESTVCVNESYTDYFWSQECVHLAPGASRAILPPRGYYQWTGGSYQIRVSTLTLPVATAATEVHIPTYDPDLPTRGDPPTAPRFSDVYWRNISDSRQFARYVSVWTFEWNATGVELTEISWREKDRRFVSETDYTKLDEPQTGQYVITTDYAVRPQSIRIRLLRDGIWTPWSEAVEAPDLGGPLFGISMVEHSDAVEVIWEPPSLGTEIDGYRLYISRDGGSTEIIEVGQVTQAKIPIRSGDEQYRLRIASFSKEHGDGGSGHAYYKRQPPELSLSLAGTGSWCQATPGDRARVDWYIKGGAAPFIVSIADRLGLMTTERHGSTVVDCVWNEDRSQAILMATVVDARGDTASTSRDLGRVPNHWEDEESDSPVELSLRSVHRDRVWLSWTCHHRTYQAVLRWRGAGEREWTYDPNFVHTWDADWVCRAVVDGLQPLTTYEYQLARIDPHEEVRRPDQLRWTETQTVTTLGEPQQPGIERDGETVSVNWERQPDAWAYVVGLRAKGRSWWKLYEPSGESRETVYFYGIPSNLELDLELISPPLEDGEEARPKWFGPNIAYGE